MLPALREKEKQLQSKLIRFVIRTPLNKMITVLGLIVMVFFMSSWMLINRQPTVIEKVLLKRDTVTIEKTKIKIKTKIIKEKVYDIRPMMNSLKTGIGVTESSKVNRLHGYTPFEIAMYFLKAHESFRPGKYPDGDYPSKGFGLNLTPEHIKWANKKLGFDCLSRNWTYEEGQKLLREYWQDMKDEELKKNPNIDDFHLVAILLHKYNTGNTRSINACCGASKGCGSKNRDVRKVHNERRKFEVALKNHKVTPEQMEFYHSQAIKLDKKWKK